MHLVWAMWLEELDVYHGRSMSLYEDLGIVLGVTSSVALGLFVVGLCHLVILAFCTVPREATGKIVCANCHLSVQPQQH